MTCSKKTASLVLLAAFFSAHVVHAEPAPDTLPSGYSPVHGSTSYSVDGSVGTLVSSGPSTVGHWDSFSIGSQASFNAQIEGTHLSKVVGQSPSEIFGALNVQSGQFFLVNPNGIVFGPSSQVNTPGLVASTLNILENDFLAGRYDFSAVDGANGSLLNQGNIHVEKGGYLALVGRSVANEGVVSATGAGVVMAAGDEVTVSLDTHGLVSAAVKDPVQADVYDLAGNKIADTLSNTGAIHADGGYAVLTARSAENVFDNVINHSGVITANTVENKNGIITLSGGADAGVVNITGDLEASGGDIHVTGNKIGVFEQASLDVSSQSGDGGKIIVFAEDIALAYGSFSADAAASGGDGGFIETSGKNYLDTAGIRLSARAVEGDPGTWLLDPANVTIAAVTSANGSFSGGVFTPSANGAIADVATINANLDAGTSVVINTLGAGSESGDITVNAPITKSVVSTATLTLNAAGSIIINESISSTVGVLGVIMTATAGNITIGNGAGDTINANGGTVNLTATAGVINGNTSASPHITASSISLSSGTGIGTASVLKIDTPLLSSATVSGAGLINVSDASGGLIVTTATTSNGNITLDAVAGNLTVLNANAPGAGNDIILTTTTSGDVILGTVTAQDTVTITSAGGIRDNLSDSAADISVATSVTMSAVNGIGDNALGSIDMNSPLTDASVSGTGDMSLNLLGGGIKTLGTLSTNNGDIDITSADSLRVGTVTAGSGSTAGDISIVTTAGFVRDEVGANDAVADLIGDNVSVTAVTGIGEANTSGNLDTNSLDFFGTTNTGGIYINLMNSFAAPTNLPAGHTTDAFFNTSGVGDIIVTSSAGAGTRTIDGAYTFSGNIQISSGDGDLYVDNIYTDLSTTSGISDIFVTASGASSGDLYIGYLDSLDMITLTATTGNVYDDNADLLNIVAGGAVDLNAAGDVGAATNLIEYNSPNAPDVSGVSGSNHLISCDSFFCGELTDTKLLDAVNAAYTSLYSDSFSDANTDSSSDSAMEDGKLGDEAAGGEEDTAAEGEESDKSEKDEEDEEGDEESTEGSGQTQTEQQKDIENDTPATDNVTVNAETFKTC